jgi:hypothetical protein
MTKLSRFSKFCGKPLPPPKGADGHRVGMEGKWKLYVATIFLSYSDINCKTALIHGNRDDVNRIKAVIKETLLKYLLFSVYIILLWCAGIAQSVQRPRYGLDGPGIESQWAGWGGQIFPTRPDRPCGAHPVSYTMDTGSFPGGKAAGAWRWPPTPI